MMDIERFDPETGDPTLALEHYHRYVVASQFVEQKTVLDIACGEGYGSAYLSLSAHAVLGIDMNQDVVKHAQQKYRTFPRVRFEVGSCEALGERDDQFDVIVSFETIEHLDQDAQRCFLEGVTQRLNPNGILLLSTPHKDIYRRTHTPTNPFHRHELSFELLQELLEAHFQYIAYAFQSTIVASHIESALQGNQSTMPCIVRDNLFEVPTSTRLSVESPFIVACCSNAPIPEDMLTRWRSCYWDTAKVQQIRDLLGWGQQLERELNDARQHCQRLQTELEQRTDWALKLDKELTEKNAYIHRLQQEFEQRTAWALSLDQELQEKNHFIQKLQREFEERTTWALRLDTEVQEMRRRFSIVQQQTQESDMVNEYLMRQLQHVHSSLLYRSLSAIGLLPRLTSFEITRP